MEGVAMSAEVFTGVRFGGRHWEPDFHIAHYVDGEVLCLDCAVDCHKCGELKEGAPTTVREIAEGFLDAEGSAFPHRWGCEECGSSLFDHFVNGLELVTEDFRNESDLLAGSDLWARLSLKYGIDALMFSAPVGEGHDETTLAVGDFVANVWHETFTGTTDEGRSVSSLSLALLRLAVTVHCADNGGEVSFTDTLGKFTLSAIGFLRETAK